MSIHIDPTDIEKRLRELQHDISPNEARLSLFNLVVFVQEKDENRLTEILNQLHGKRPARVIVIRQGHGGMPHVDISARCITDPYDKVQCVQEVVIFTGENGEGKEKEAWSPLLIRDIPVYLWWLDNPEELPFFDKTEELIDRWFFDSDMASQTSSFFRNLTERLSAIRVPLTDLAWIRLLPVMKMTARFFDPPEMRSRLNQITGIEISGMSKAQAELYFRWLSHRLGWNNAGKQIQFKHQNAASLCQGFEVIFQTDDNNKLSLGCTTEGCTLLRAPDQPCYTEVFQVPSDGELLVQEMDKNFDSRLYIEVLTQTSTPV